MLPLKFLSIQDGAYIINPAQIASIERKGDPSDCYFTLTMGNGQEFDVDEQEDIDKLQALIPVV